MNLINGGRPRAVPLIRRHAARVAAIEFAAFCEEIWKRRQARLLIDDELSGVGISGRAAPLATQSAAVFAPCSFFLCILTGLKTKATPAPISARRQDFRLKSSNAPVRPTLRQPTTSRSLPAKPPLPSSYPSPSSLPSKHAKPVFCTTARKKYIDGDQPRRREHFDTVLDTTTTTHAS